MSHATPTRRAVAAALAALPLAACAGRVDPGDGFAADSTDAVILARFRIANADASSERAGRFAFNLRTAAALPPDPRNQDPSRPPPEPDYGRLELALPGAEEAPNAGAVAAGVAVGAALGAFFGSGVAARVGPKREIVVPKVDARLVEGIARMVHASATDYVLIGAGIWRGDVASRWTGRWKAAASAGRAFWTQEPEPTDPPNVFVDAAGQPLRFTAAPRTVSYLGDFELTVAGERLLLTGYGHDRAAAEAHLRANAPKMLDALTIVDLKPALAPRP